MPSREKIAGWLKKEGDSTVKIWADLIGTERANEKAAIWYNRAAQVENMRCENCEYSPDEILTCETDEPVWECSRADGEHSKDFGCWYFEPKEK